MAETPLDYDKIIWQVFYVGVISSVVLLYHAKYTNLLDPLGKDLALILGFSVLVYSFFLVLGYGFKKKIAAGSNSNKEMAEKLDKLYYPRVRWMGESILLFIAVSFIILFYDKLALLVLIMLIAVILCLIANFQAMNKQCQKKECKCACDNIKKLTPKN